jgi:hypothetical protein
MGENIIKNCPTPDILIRRHFSHKRFPQKILLRKPLLNHIGWEVLMDISLVASTITSMARDTLTEQLLDGRDERPAPRERESGERDISSL